MNLRASALVRRFRTRAPSHTNAVLKTVRSKNGNKRLRILPKTGLASPGDHEVVYGNRSTSSHSMTSSSQSNDSFSFQRSPLQSPTASPPFLPSSASCNYDINQLLDFLLTQSAFTLYPRTQPFCIPALPGVALSMSDPMDVMKMPPLLSVHMNAMLLMMNTSL